MPRQVLPDAQSFEELEQRLLSEEFRRALTSQKPISIPGQPDKEAGFIFSSKNQHNRLRVYVWTTFLPAKGRAREVDSGWVLISEDGDRKYVARPSPRTKNFLETLFRKAWIAKCRVVNRPRCEVCDRFMDIIRRESPSDPTKYIKARYWRCPGNCQKDGKPSCAGWDIGLPDKAKKWVHAQRKSRRRSRLQHEQKTGRMPTPAVLIRSRAQR